MTTYHKPEFIDNFNIPDYALPFLINGDDSNLTEDDLTTIEFWLQQFPYDVLIYEPLDDYAEFDEDPAFGMACNTIKCAIHGQNPQQFTDTFDNFACVGDTISLETMGFTVTATIVEDPEYTIDDDDVHNPDQSVTGCDDEQFKRLLEARQAWLNNEWFYCGVVLSVSKADIVLDNHAASLWGIECNYPHSENGNAYLTDVANELLDEAIEAGQLAFGELLHATK